MFATATSDGSFRLVNVFSGVERDITREEYETIIFAECPVITEPAEDLEAECVRHLDTLFAHVSAHPVRLDGVAIEPVDGGSPGMSYTSYSNGHTLTTDGDTKTYTVYTYVRAVEMEEQMVFRQGRIAAILINTFDYAGIRTSAPEHASWKADLVHMRNVLRDATDAL